MDLTMRKASKSTRYTIDIGTNQNEGLVFPKEK